MGFAQKRLIRNEAVAIEKQDTRKLFSVRLPSIAPQVILILVHPEFCESWYRAKNPGRTSGGLFAPPYVSTTNPSDLWMEEYSIEKVPALHGRRHHNSCDDVDSSGESSGDVQRRP